MIGVSDVFAREKDESGRQEPRKKVIVGMSGGVDSSVSALLLKKQGFEVIGLFMKNWEEDQAGDCPAATDYQDVARVCEVLDIPYYSVEFIKGHWYLECLFFLLEFAYFQGSSRHNSIPYVCLACAHGIYFRS